MAKSNILDEILAHCFTIDENKCLRDTLLFTAMVLLHVFLAKFTLTLCCSQLNKVYLNFLAK